MNQKATGGSFLSSKRVVVVILSIVFSSLILGGWRYLNQQSVDKQADEILSQVEMKSEKLLDAKNKDSKVELSLIQDLLLELDRVETLLSGAEGNKPDTVAAVTLVKKVRDSVKMIEEGILNNDADLKEKGYNLFESLMFSK